MMMTFVPRLSPFRCLTCAKRHRKISKTAVLGARSLTESTKNRVKKLCPHLFVEHPSREKRSELECAFRRGGSGRWPVAPVYDLSLSSTARRSLESSGLVQKITERSSSTRRARG